jgi:hypothetical protein
MQLKHIQEAVAKPKRRKITSEWKYCRQKLRNSKYFFRDVIGTIYANKLWKVEIGKFLENLIQHKDFRIV